MKRKLVEISLPGTSDEDCKGNPSSLPKPASSTTLHSNLNQSSNACILDLQHLTENLELVHTRSTSYRRELPFELLLNTFHQILLRLTIGLQRFSESTSVTTPPEHDYYA
ncbi:Uncharacterized protein Rs2_43981 [Raphanus sativus]|nr:Uncharacterized protein Rs2_43981 [Raphanus sativus]